MIKLDLHDIIQYLCSFDTIILAKAQSANIDILPDYQRHEIAASRPGVEPGVEA